MTAPIPAQMPELLRHQQPDVGHEALRLAFLQALSDLFTASVSMAQFQVALQTLTALANSYAAALPASVSDRQSLHDTDASIISTVAALALRVVALESKPAVRTVAVAAPVSLGLLSVGSRDVVLQLDRTLPDTSYEVDPWPSAGLLGAAKFVLKTKTTTSVTYTVTNTALIAAGGSLAAVCWRSA